MKSTLQAVAVLTIVAVAIILMGTMTADAGCGYGFGYGYSGYSPCYNYCAPIYPVHTCVPTYYTPYFNSCYYGY